MADSVGELLAAVDRREAYRSADARSPAHFERVWIGGEPHVVKYVHLDDDFAMRMCGDIGCLPLRTWAAGIMDVAADAIDHAVIGMAGGHGRNQWGAAILMRDVSAELIPVGDDPLLDEQHDTFINSLAVLSARMWGWRDDIGLLPYDIRWRWFDLASMDVERDLGYPEPVPRIASEGWAKFATRAPGDVVAAVDDLRHDILPLLDALAATPSTFLHGDWKLGNLAYGRDGRTILFDWAYPGEGPVCHEIAWYVALNRARLPVGQTKESTIEAFRAALERHGVSTAGWWDDQLALCLLGTLVRFGWEKALGPDEELGWWCDRAREGLAHL